MRALAIALGILAAASPAAAQAGRTLDEPVGGWSVSGVPWVLDDGEGAALPWDAHDPEVDPEPRGIVHLYLQTRLGALALSDDSTASGPSFELSAMLDLRYGRRSSWHVRLGITAGARWIDEQVDEFSGERLQTSPVWLSARLQPLVFDLGRIGVFRAGGDAGLQWMPTAEGGHFQFLPEASGEVVFRVDDARLEVGVYGGVRASAVHPVEPRGWTRLNPQLHVGVTIGSWVP